MYVTQANHAQCSKTLYLFKENSLTMALLASASMAYWLIAPGSFNYYFKWYFSPSDNV